MPQNKAIKLVFFFLVLLLSCSRNKTDSISIKNEGNDLFQLAKSYYAKDMYDSAIQFFSLAAAYFHSNNDYLARLRSLRYLSDCQWLNGYPEIALNTSNIALSYANNHLRTGDIYFSELLRSRAQILQHLKMYDSALNTIKMAIAIAKDSSSDDSLLHSFYQIEGKIYFLLNDNQNALICFLQAISEAQNVKQSSEMHYYSAALTYRKLGNLMKAKDFFQHAMKQEFCSSSESKNYRFEKEMTYLKTIIELGFYADAKEFLDSISIDFHSIRNLDTKTILFGLNIKGRLAFYNGDVEKAINYYSQGVNIAIDSIEFINQQISFMHNLGICHQTLHNYENALAFYKYCLLLCRNNNEPNIAGELNGIAGCYYALGIFDSSEYYYQKAINVRLSTKPVNMPLLARDYKSYGFYFLQVSNFPLAHLYLKKAEKIFHQILGPIHPELGECYEYEADIYRRAGDNKKSCLYYQKAINANTREYNSKSLTDLPYTKYVISKLRMITCLNKLGSLRMELTEKSDKADTQGILDCYRLADSLIYNHNMSLSAPKSRITLAGMLDNVYANAVTFMTRLYSKTRRPEFKEAALVFSDHRRVFSLRASMADKYAENYGVLPDSLVERERDLNYYSSVIRNALDDEMTSENPDYKRIKLLEQQQFDQSERLTQLTSLLEKKYPSYFSEKFAYKAPKVNQIRQQLAQEEAIVEYFIDKQNLTTFILSTDTFTMVESTLPEGFRENINTFKRGTQQNTSEWNDRVGFEKWCNSSVILYNVLVKPVLRFGNYNKITIVPESNLGFLPFELFLTRQPQKSSTYRTLPYLLNVVDISYAYSLDQLTAGDGNNDRKGSLVAFAPFSANKGNKTLSQLPFSHQEAKDVTKVFGGLLVTDQEATEESFRHYAPHFQIIHLASHAELNNDDPADSYIAFNKPAHSTADGMLHAYELNSIPFNADLVVLSACNTGKGKQARGEGELSLAYSFACAGCPRMIMSIWPVGDNSTSTIMQLFYSGIRSGLKPSVALRQAKLTFLQTADPLKVHPLYWAGFIMTGNDNILIKEKPVGPPLLRAYLIICIIVCLWLIVYLHFHK